MNSELLQGFYLGDLLVEPLTGQVTGRSQATHLPPKAMEVLLCLASDPGALVTRETLIDNVWGAGHGSQEALSHAVSEVRHALDDRPANPKFVQTLPRRGYRLIVPPAPVSATDPGVAPAAGGGKAVEELGVFENLKRRGVLETALAYLVLGWLLIQVADIVFDQLLLPPWTGTFVTVLIIAGFPIAVLLSWFLEIREGRAVLDTVSPRDARRRQFSRTYLSIIGAMAIAGVMVFVYDRSIGLPEADIGGGGAADARDMLSPIQDNSVAVLPFFNIDGSDDTQVFANGLADDVITRLSQVPGLLVSARGDSFTLDPNSPSSSVRERLRVALYLEGSVEIAGNRLRAIVQLIDSKTGFHVFSRRFDRPLAGFFEIRDEITELTVANVRIALPPETQLLPPADLDASDLDAYLLYRRGKDLFEEPQTPESIARVIDYYGQALDIDPQYAAAHAGLCVAYVARYGLSNAAADITSAENACASALVSNPRLYMVQTALGDLYLRTDRTAAAERAFGEALKINPRDARAMIGLSDVYTRQRQYPEAERLLEAAIAAQPGNWRTINGLGSFLFSMGRYAEAADAYRQVTLLDPENFQARTNLGGALTMAGDFEAGKQVLEESLAIRENATAYSNLAVVYYYLGEFGNSVATHRKAIELSPGEAVKWLNLADALFFAGEREEALAAFERAADLAESRIGVDPGDVQNIFTLAWAWQMLGESDKAHATVERGLAIAPVDPYGFYYDALIQVSAGRKELALASLRLAVDYGYPSGMLAEEPYLEELRGTPEFEAIISGEDR